MLPVAVLSSFLSNTTVPGLFCLAVGILTIIAMRHLLPDRKAPESAFESTGDYTVELRVPSDNPNIGKTLGEAGLFHVKGGSLPTRRAHQGGTAKRGAAGW